MKKLKHVYNTVTRKYEDVEVNEEIYNCYRRTMWNIADNDKKHGKNEIQFTALIGGHDDSFENFKEFISQKNNPLHILVHKSTLFELREAYFSLSVPEKNLLDFLVIGQQSERRYAEIVGIPQKTINCRKNKILKKLKKILS